MLALRKSQPGFGLELGNAADPPAPGADEVTLRIEHVGICGSDVHAYEWTDGYGFMVPHLPVTMGHEFAGRVVARGSGVALQEGATVTVMPMVACGNCPSCARNEPRNCQRRQAIGLTCDG